MGQPAYPTRALQAAALLESATRNHPLIDGNKRTGWVLVVVFLALNGMEHDMDAGQVFELVVGVAEGGIELEKFSGHRRPHSADEILTKRHPVSAARSLWCLPAWRRA